MNTPLVVQCAMDLYPSPPSFSFSSSSSSSSFSFFSRSIYRESSTE